VSTVAEAGWAGVKNGTLLRLAEAEYDVFNTADRNLPHKHTLRTFSLGVVVLTAGSTRLEDLQPLAAELREAIVYVRPGRSFASR
jgi:hypothetical protein